MIRLRRQRRTHQFRPRRAILVTILGIVETALKQSTKNEHINRFFDYVTQRQGQTRKSSEMPEKEKGKAIDLITSDSECR